MFEHEQTAKALSQQLNQSRDFAQTNLKYMYEVLGVFEHISEIVNGFSPREDKEDESPIKD
jgi:fructose-1,6-bisphosphatase